MFERHNLHWNGFGKKFLDDSDLMSPSWAVQQSIKIKNFRNLAKPFQLFDFMNGTVEIRKGIHISLAANLTDILSRIYRLFIGHSIVNKMKTLLSSDNFTTFVTNETIWEIVTNWTEPFLIDCPKINPNLKCSDNRDLKCHRNYCWQVNHTRWWCIRWNFLIGLKSDLESFSSRKSLIQGSLEWFSK